jgi:hypothetical protein
MQSSQMGAGGGCCPPGNCAPWGGAPEAGCASPPVGKGGGASSPDGGAGGAVLGKGGGMSDGMLSVELPAGGDGGTPFSCWGSCISDWGIVILLPRGAGGCAGGELVAAHPNKKKSMAATAMMAAIVAILIQAPQSLSLPLF